MVHEATVRIAAAQSASGQLLAAATFAARKHSTQRRKDADASPYINHPLALADVLANVGGEVG